MCVWRGDGSHPHLAPKQGSWGDPGRVRCGQPVVAKEWDGCLVVPEAVHLELLVPCGSDGMDVHGGLHGKGMVVIE